MVMTRNAPPVQAAQKKPRRYKTKLRGVPSRQKVKSVVQANPHYFCQNVLGIDLWEKQRRILHTLFNSSKRRLAVPASFSVGKTFTAASAVLFFLYNFPPAKVITLAPTWRQVKNLLWRDIRKQHKNAVIPLGGTPIMTELSLDEDWYAIGFSTQDSEDAIEKITGIHSPNVLVVFDQAAGMSDVFWNGAKAILTSQNSYWLALGNTTIYNSKFRRICEEKTVAGLGEWDVLPITAYDSPNVIEGREVVPGLVTREWVADMETLGEDDPLFRIFCRAEFIPATDLLLIPNKEVTPAFNRTVPLGRALRVGLDIARQGTDSTVWTLWSGGQLLDIEGVHGHLTGPVVRKTKSLIAKWEALWDMPVEVVNGDANGLGAGVMDILEEEGVPIYRCIGSASADEEHRFKNFRASQAWNLRDMFLEKRIGMKLPDEVEMTPWKKRAVELLRTALEGVTYKIDRTSQKILLADKDTLKKELGHSPDEFDSVIYGAWDNQFASTVVEAVVDEAPIDTSGLWADESDILQLDENGFF